MGFCFLLGLCVTRPLWRAHDQDFLSGHFTGTSLEPERIHHVNADVVIKINIMSPDVYGTNETGASACITLSSGLLFFVVGFFWTDNLCKVCFFFFLTVCLVLYTLDLCKYNLHYATGAPVKT